MIQNLLLISTLSIGLLNLFVPFVTSQNSNIRNFLLITISAFFLGNVAIIDYLFLNFIEIKITLFTFGQYKVALHAEAIGMIFLNLLSILWICALIYTTSFLEINNIKRNSQFIFFLNLAIFCGFIIALSANLFTMFLGYEALTLSTFPLISHQNSAKVRAGLYQYFKILMGSSLLFFLTAIIIIYAKVGHGDFTTSGLISSFFSQKFTIILLLLFIFGISKTAIFPLHGWLPAAMVASYPVSALLHAVVVVKAGLFCLYKVLVYVFGFGLLQEIILELQYNWFELIPVITILYSASMAMMSRDIKTILAYSTITQLNIALLGAFLFTPKAIAAAIIHMVSHSFTKICLFYSAGNFYSLYHSYKIEELLGMSKKMPKTSFIFLLSILSIIGVPPFAGFVSKFYIMLAAAESDNFLVMFTLIFSSLLSAIYMGRMVIYVYKLPYSNIHYKSEERKLPRLMLLSLLGCFAPVVLFYPVLQIGMNSFLAFL